jgi:hypothetical protein
MATADNSFIEASLAADTYLLPVLVFGKDDYWRRWTTVSVTR